MPKARQLTTPWGTVEYGGVGTNRRFLVIHNNGGKYPTVEHTTNDLWRAESKVRQWSWQHQPALSIWDTVTGERVK